MVMKVNKFNENINNIDMIVDGLVFNTQLSKRETIEFIDYLRDPNLYISTKKFNL